MCFLLVRGSGLKILQLCLGSDQQTLLPSCCLGQRWAMFESLTPRILSRENEEKFSSIHRAVSYPRALMSSSPTHLSHPFAGSSDPLEAAPQVLFPLLGCGSLRFQADNNKTCCEGREELSRENRGCQLGICLWATVARVPQHLKYALKFLFFQYSVGRRSKIWNLGDISYEVYSIMLNKSLGLL